jgi:hypothetical protein
MTQGRGLAGGIGVIVAMLAAHGTAHAAELTAAERSGGVPGQVTVLQGRSADFTIEVAAFGTVTCVTTRTLGVGARVHTRYAVTAGGASTGTPSGFLPFFSNGRSSAGSPGFCGVSWNGAPNPYRVRARVSVAHDARPGIHTVPLRLVVSNGALGPLQDSRQATVQIRVIQRYSPPGRVLLVNANLKAANLTDSGSLTRGTSRMRLFADRVLKDLRGAGQPLPDIFTLQEVVNRSGRRGPVSALYLAGYLSRKTGDPYSLVVSPGARASLKNSGTYRETAIIANLRTMRWPTASGFVGSPCRAWSGACRRGAPTWSQAYAVIPEASPLGRTFPIASVHVLPRLKSVFPCGTTRGCLAAVHRLRRRWVLAVVDRLRAVSGSSFTRAVVAGDFNAARGTPFYTGIRDAGFVNALPNLRSRTDPFRVVDFIFTRGSVFRADYDHRRLGRGGFPYGYSDHRFLWAAIGG